MQLATKSRFIVELSGKDGHISNQDYKGDKPNGFGLMLQDFFHHVESGTTLNLGLVDETMVLLDALYWSDQSRSTVAGEFHGTG